ncbi:glycoside hydrolase family 16 protein [Apiospora phragmitis]|uniref:Glycoside hydrolase family 16 protein n=1 Tax=Apiospora phragmitis TaxID=2905665 RepID=A0ABR1TSP8_9PEZI
MSPCRRPLAILAAYLVVVLCQRANYPLTSDSNCACYQTNETATQFLSHHKFFDFRSLPQYVHVPKPVDDPALSAGVNVSSDYFSSSNWTSWWDIQTWNNSDTLPQGNQTNTTISDATVLMVNSPGNIYLERNTDARPSSQTYLTMRTVRHKNFQSAAEFESVVLDFRYLSNQGLPGRHHRHVHLPPPAQDMSKVQEADLEVRTTDPQYSIQYTNQPSWNDDGDVPGATQNISDPRHVDWGSWQVHRMDWTPKASNWFVNGKLLSTISFQVPRDGSQVIFNSWSNGGSWSGNMSLFTEAYLQVQWIEIVYNNTIQLPPGQPYPGWPFPGQPSTSCKSVCSIDHTSVVGTPVLITNPGIPGNPGNPGNPGGGNGYPVRVYHDDASTSAKYGQCAGKTWKGCTNCAAGTTCRFQNDYYSQCL